MLGFVLRRHLMRTTLALDEELVAEAIELTALRKRPPWFVRRLEFWSNAKVPVGSPDSVAVSPISSSYQGTHRVMIW